MSDYLSRHGIDTSEKGIPSAVFAASPDCKIMGGYFIEAMEWGPVNTPTLVVIE